ncbi:hypothetical protein AIOL_002071 [Candidatus Rhodobacter oscarellae]|uniref:Uncharacterized protein n=1 Tax=Candidatus Rhodobacter oscarellae TaxID=1675527 RepID=A0A0J9E342_9RHOB|nr:hypothetical protein [Candidatus Rhodobacter lobularis]KMW57112.1 hypothetical protein AIOL_002071 [Candidatus Rhodobacter lobularis]
MPKAQGYAPTQYAGWQIKRRKQNNTPLRQAKYLAEGSYSVLIYGLRGHGKGDLGPIPRASNEHLGFDMAKPDVIDHTPRITAPALVVQNKNDPWTQMGMVQRYFDALTVEKELRLLDLEKSRFAAYDFIGSHPGELMGCFDTHLNGGAV